MEKLVRKYYKKSNPYFYIMLSFALVILVGTFLLWLPISTKDRKGLSFIDSFFMTTSATCVTGLSVVADVGSTLSIFGKLVMMVLMEIGGLSFLTIAFFLVSLVNKKLKFSTRFLLKQALNADSINNFYPLIRKIVIIAVTIQLIGAVSYTIILLPHFESNFFKAMGVACFMAISSFCNAGFDTLGSNSCINFSSNIMFNITTIFLIVTGGIGFIVIMDVFTKKKFKGYNLHTKIVLIATLALLVVPTILFKVLNPDLTILEALFLSTTARTAGFTTIDLNRLTPASMLLLKTLMFIGASPCSTGGGIKTTTFVIIILNIVAFMRGKPTRIFKTNISGKSIINAYVLVTFSIIYVALTMFILCIANPSSTFNEVSFETISAFATVGLSLGLTAKITAFSKIILCFTMFMGRVGPLTITSLWNHNWNSTDKEDIQYVTEDIIVG